MKEMLKIFIPVIAFLILLAALNNYLLHKQCANTATEMNKQYRYDILYGCRIQLNDGTFIYWEMYRAIE